MPSCGGATGKELGIDRGEELEVELSADRELLQGVAAYAALGERPVDSDMILGPCWTLHVSKESSHVGREGRLRPSVHEEFHAKR